MNKKRALVCWIILYGLGLVAFFVGLSLPEDTPARIIGLVFTLFFMFIIGGSVMGCVYARLRRREMQADRHCDDRAFECWLNRFAPFIRTGAKLTVTDGKKFCKFGGLPSVPADFCWPLCNGQPLPFLLQIDFAEVNSCGDMTDFPTCGLLYIFADDAEINDPAEGQGEECAQGRAFRILFCENGDNLRVAEKPETLGTVYNEYYLGAESVVTYPDTDDCNGAHDIYCDRPFGGMDDEYDDLQGQYMDATLIGGWASYIQSSRMSNECNSAEEWVLLAQIGSVAGDEKLMWGDSGTLYFYIRRADLLARRFDNVRLDMQCY